MTSKVSSLSLSITGLLILSFLSLTNVNADHHVVARNKNFQAYCIDYLQPRFGASGAQCEPSIEACEQRLQEYQARSELDPSDPDYLVITNPDTCYRHDKEYVNFSENPYMRQYQ